MSGFLNLLPAYESRASVDAFNEDDKPSAFTDTVEAAFSLTRREELFDSAERARRQKVEERATVIESLGGNKSLALDYSRVPSAITDAWREWERRGEQGEPPDARAHSHAWQSYQYTRDFERRFPGQVKDDMTLFEEFRAESGELREAEQFILERGGGFAAFAGTAGAVFTDPLVLMTLPFGAGAAPAGAGALRTAGRVAAVEGSIAAAVEIPIQAQVYNFKRELEAPWSFRDSAVNVLAAGVGGGLLGGLIGGGAVGARNVLERYRAAKAAGDVVPTPEMDAAERILEAADQVDSQNPLDSGIRSSDAPDEVIPAESDHHAALETARAQDQVGQPIDVSEQVAGVEPVDGINEAIDRAGDPRQLTTVDPGDVEIDANTFQFKSGADGDGVTDTLKDVKRFDRRLAGVSIIWENNAGQRFIADGHQRRALALRARAAGQAADETMLNGFVLREADGVTAGDARKMAAVKNMAEGTGSPIDAAKILREVGELGDAMLPPLPPRSALVRQARGLAQLTDDNFLQAVNGVIDERFAALVGSATRDGKLQQAMIEVLRKTKPANETQARSIVDQVRTAGIETRVTEDLFGESSISESLYLERAQVLDSALRESRKDRAVFGRLVAEESRISDAGNRLNRSANQQRIQEANDATAQISALANAKGPISEALTQAARRVKAGDAPVAAASDFLQAARREILEGNIRRPETGRARSSGDAPSVEELVQPKVGEAVRIMDLPANERPIAVQALIARQADQSVDDIFKVAELNQERLTVVAEEIAEELGEDVQLANPGIKKRAVLEESLERKGKTAGEVTDAVRLGFMVRTPDIAARIIDRLAERFEVLDEGVTVTGMGYVDHKALVRFSDGKVGEVQLWDPEIARAKFGEAGRIFEETRSISAEDLAADPALAARMQAATEASKDLYAEALANGSPEWRRMAMMTLPDDMRQRVQSLLDAGAGGGNEGALGNISRNADLESSEPEPRISAGEARDQASAPDDTNSPSTPPPGTSRTTAGRASQLKNRSAIDAPPRSIVRQVADESTAAPDPTRTGTIADEEYRLVMDQFEDLSEKMGEQLQVFSEVDGELVPRSARATVDRLDSLEDTLERVRVCNTSTRSAA